MDEEPWEEEEEKLLDEEPLQVEGEELLKESPVEEEHEEEWLAGEELLPLASRVELLLELTAAPLSSDVEFIRYTLASCFNINYNVNNIVHLPYLMVYHLKANSRQSRRHHQTPFQPCTPWIRQQV